jgi:hypothetical protein
MDITGARSGLKGAETALKLRVLRTNGDFPATGPTSNKNEGEPTKPATPTAKSREPPDAPSGEPHPSHFDHDRLSGRERDRYLAFSREEVIDGRLGGMSIGVEAVVIAHQRPSPAEAGPKPSATL